MPIHVLYLEKFCRSTSYEGVLFLGSSIVNDTVVPVEHAVIAEHRVGLSLGFRYDIHAAAKLDELLSMRAEKLPVVRLRDLVEKLAKLRTVLILMPGPSLAKLLDGIRLLSEYAHGVIIVDSAVDYLYRVEHVLKQLKDLFETHILVTDLDPSLHALRQTATMLNSVVVVHAHGGNFERLDFVLELANPVCGTCQVYLPYLRYVSYCPGFTDGDRATYMAQMAGCRTLMLGWDPDVEQCLSDKPLTKVKRYKLSVAKGIMYELRMLGGLFLF